MYFAFFSYVACMLDEEASKDVQRSLMSRIGSIGYPKMTHVYNIDAQTKLVLLGIMVLLFVLVLSTTMKMVEDVLKIRMKNEESKV